MIRRKIQSGGTGWDVSFEFAILLHSFTPYARLLSDGKNLGSTLNVGVNQRNCKQRMYVYTYVVVRVAAHLYVKEGGY